MRAAAVPAGPVSEWVAVVALGLLLGLQPVTTDLYLPALPQLKHELGLTPAAAQWTLSVVILAFGFGQLVWGSIADRFGRRPVLRWGLSLYVLASLMAVFARDLGVLIAARAAQGAMLSAAVVCGRATIRDLYAPEHGARVMAHASTGLGLIALTGPILSGLTATWFGWRATLAVLMLAGLGTLTYIWLLLPETLPVARRQQVRTWGEMLADWRQILRHPTFRAHTMLTSSTYGGLYVYLALSAFVFIEIHGVQRTHYGLVMASISLAYLVGTVFCRHTLPHRGLVGTVRIGSWASLCGALLMISVSLAQLVSHQLPPAWTLLPGMWIYAFGHGFHQPCGQTGVVASFPTRAGAASALSGFLLAFVAFLIGAIVAWWSSLPTWAGTIHPMTLGMGLGGLCTAWIGLGRVQRDGAPPLHA
jgi:DHA1 family bicyclomycin/chloramphenicol resistance-like MFS transporter